jgi:aspartate-semialdehyde dehydrogenase
MIDAASSGDLRVAVVGATGVAGGQVAELLAERNFPASEITLFASEHGATETVVIGEEDRPVTELTDTSDLAGFDIAFLAVPPSVAADIVRGRPGPVLIDMSAAGRSASSVPMAAPGCASHERLSAIRRGDVIAIPHPSAYALAAILQALGTTPSFVAATLMLGASTGGKDEIDKLMEESADLLNARLDIADDEQQRAFNIYPADDETEIINVLTSQVRAMLGVAFHLVMRALRVPIFYGTALSISIPAAPESDAWVGRLREAPGVMLIEEEMPPSVIDSAGQESVVVSLYRNPNGAALWCVIDNARLAALCAVWAAEGLSLEAPNRL